MKAQAASASLGIGTGSAADGDDTRGDGAPRRQLTLQFDEFSRAIMARIVRKCGSRTYWEDWASDVARIAEVHITRIGEAVKRKGSEERTAFEKFLAEIRGDLNESVTEAEAVEMLAQHIITRPVFRRVLRGLQLRRAQPGEPSPASRAGRAGRAKPPGGDGKADQFYASVRRRAAGIEDAAARQKIVVELYDKFFRTAFPV